MLGGVPLEAESGTEYRRRKGQKEMVERGDEKRRRRRKRRPRPPPPLARSLVQERKPFVTCAR